MKTFQVEITEILQKIILIDAEDENEAYVKVSDMYENCDIILDADDFIQNEINLLN